MKSPAFILLLFISLSLCADHLTINRQVYPSTVVKYGIVSPIYPDTFEVTTVIEGFGIVDRKSIWSCFSIDRSGSMDGILDDAQDLTEAFIRDYLDSTIDEVALNWWNTAVDPGAIPLTDIFQDVYDALTFGAGGGTDLNVGLIKCLDQLTVGGAIDLEEVSPVVIFISDGVGDYDNANAQNLADADIRVFSIGIGPGVSDVDLQAMADTTGGEYFYITDVSELEDVFTAILELVLDCPTNIDVYDYYRSHIVALHGMDPPPSATDPTTYLNIQGDPDTCLTDQDPGYEYTFRASSTQGGHVLISTPEAKAQYDVPSMGLVDTTDQIPPGTVEVLCDDTCPECIAIGNVWCIRADLPDECRIASDVWDCQHTVHTEPACHEEPDSCELCLWHDDYVWCELCDEEPICLHKDDPATHYCLHVYSSAAPLCDQPVLYPAKLWPPDQGWQRLDIRVRENPCVPADCALVTPMRVQQDEDPNARTGYYWPATCPDGVLYHGDAWVRRERLATDFGRTYKVTFSAENDLGLTCRGEVYSCCPQGTFCLPRHNTVWYDSDECHYGMPG